MKNLFHKKDWDSASVVGVLIVVYIVWIILRIFVSYFWGIKEIGATFEAPRPYDTKYYIYLFPDGEKAKNYKVQGDIYVDSECEDYGENSTSCFDVIQLEKAYFQNGGSITFDDCSLVDENPSCFDEDGRYWSIEFHKEIIN